MTKKDQYRHFCQKEKDIPVFSKDWHLDAVTSDGHWDVVLVEKGGEIAGSLVYYLKQSGPFTYVTMPWLTKTMGPYIIPKFKNTKHEYSITKNLVEQLPKVAFYEQNFHYDISNWLPFYWKGYTQSTYYSYHIEGLNDLEKVFLNFCTDYRNNKIPKAKKQVTVRTDLSLEDFYKVKKMSFSRQGLDFVIPFDFIKKYDEVLAAQNARKIFFAVDDDDQIHSVVYLIWDNQRAYYHLAGDDPNLRSSGAGILLVWEAIQFTQKELGLNIFDFEGSMIPSIEKVRRNFGAQPVPYFNVRKYHSKIFKMLHLLKRGI